MTSAFVIVEQITMWIYSMFSLFHMFAIDAPCSTILLSLLHIIKQCKVIHQYLATNSASVIPLLCFAEHLEVGSVFAVWSSSAISPLAPPDSSCLHRHSTPVWGIKMWIGISLTFSFFTLLRNVFEQSRFTVFL